MPLTHERQVVVRSVRLGKQAAVLHFDGGAVIDIIAATHSDSVSLDDIQLPETQSRTLGVGQSVYEDRIGFVLQVETSAGGTPHLLHHARKDAKGGV